MCQQSATSLSRGGGGRQEAGRVFRRTRKSAIRRTIRRLMEMYAKVLLSICGFNKLMKRENEAKRPGIIQMIVNIERVWR